MSEIIIRTMKECDLDDVAQLSEEGFSHMYAFDWHANAKSLLAGVESGRVEVAVAEIEGEVVGYCNLRGWPAGGWIDQIVVSKNHRRSGVGRTLVDFIVKAAIQKGFWKISLIVSEEEGGVLLFYQQCGFEKVGNMKDEIKKGVDGVLLSTITDYGLHPNP